MDECELSDCYNKLDEETRTITFRVEDFEKTISVCKYHHDMMKVTSAFSIGPNASLTPIPSVPYFKKGFE